MFELSKVLINRVGLRERAVAVDPISLEDFTNTDHGFIIGVAARRSRLGSDDINMADHQVMAHCNVYQNKIPVLNNIYLIYICININDMHNTE